MGLANEAARFDERKTRIYIYKWKRRVIGVLYI